MSTARPLPIAPFVVVPEEGEPYLEGHRCAACRGTFLETARACPRCGARDGLTPARLAERGALYVYSIVHRSLPGVPVPYVSAVVDLDGGGTLKGNLVGVEPVPEQIPFGMQVEVVFSVADARDAAGNAYLTYAFRPARDASRT